MTATIKFDQVGIAAGVADQSRSDGLATGVVVTCTSTAPGTTNQWTMLWSPDADTTAAASLTPSGAVATFTPTVGARGTYRVKLVVDASLPTESTSIRTFSVRTANQALRIPALNERASSEANLINSGAAYIAQSETNEPIASTHFSGGSYGGWYATLVDLCTKFDALVLSSPDFTSGSNNPGVHGLVPAPLLGDITKFLRGDATWATVVAGITALTGDVTASGAGSVVATIAANAVSTGTIIANAVTNTKLAQVATATFKGRTTAGTGDPEDLTVTQATALLNAFTSGANNPGLKGLVPAPLLADVAKFLKADGTWTAISGGTQTVQDEGVTQSTVVTAFNFTGAGVNASGGGATATINIPGSSTPAGVTNIDATLTTANATPTTIYTHTFSAVSLALGLQLQVIGSNLGQSAHYVITAMFRNSAGNVASEVDTFFVNGPFESAAAWDVTFTPVTNTVQIKVTGQSTSVTWRITGTATEVALGTGA